MITILFILSGHPRDYEYDLQDRTGISIADRRSTDSWSYLLDVAVHVSEWVNESPWHANGLPTGSLARVG